MKKLMIILAGCAAMLATGCDKHNATDRFHASAQAQASLLEMYPDATDIAWHAKNGYAVADFRTTSSAGVNSAWFDNGGTWYMTETEISFNQLPEAVQTAFKASEYASWRVDDIDKLEREGAETVYVIEAEGMTETGEAEVDLYYSPDGVLVKQTLDADPDYDYGDFIPAQPSQGIEAYIASNYPDARIIDIDRENGMTEVEILDGSVCRELLFDVTETWLYTKTEVRRSDVPATVMQALESSQYASYRIDDVDFYQTPEGEFYRFDLESASGDVKIDITPDGTVSVAAEDDYHGNGAMVQGNVADFIAAKYPGAVIREYDYDNGMLEVEIFHDGREKSVYFNGANEWVSTEWDVRRSELPAAVTASLAASQYASYQIDDIEFVQTPDIDYYALELEQGNREVRVRITAEGRIL